MQKNKFITREEFSKRLCELFPNNPISRYPGKRRINYVILDRIGMPSTKQNLQRTGNRQGYLECFN